jgi:hypothetical protein
MTLRSRAKKFRPNEVEDDDDNVSQIGGPDIPQGASYIRYEMVEKKGKQYLVPVRYSIRRAALTQDRKAQLSKAVPLDE